MVARDLMRREIDPNFTPTNAEIIENRYKYSHDMAGKASTMLLNGLGVKKELENLRQKFSRRIPDNLLIREYKKCLKAETIIRDKFGKRIDAEPNHSIKLKAVEDGFKIKGALIDNQVNVDAREVNVGADPAQLERMSAVIAELDVLASKLGINSPNYKPINQLHNHIVVDNKSSNNI